MITKIHSKYYDLSNFKHPAGDIPLKLASDRDATELFENHHLFSDRQAMLKMLEKYEIDEPADVIPDNNIYDWRETLNSDFTRELKQIMRETIHRRDIKYSLRDWSIIAALWALYVINLYYYYQKNHYALLVYPLTLWVATVNTYHDASHFALSNRPIINQLGTLSALMFSLTYCWYHQHIIGHHSFVNILTRDPDLYHSPLYLRHTSNIRKNKYHKYQHIAMWLLWFLAVPVGLIYTSFIKTIEGKPYNKVVQLSRKLEYRTMYFELSFVIMYMFVAPYLFIGDLLFVIYPYLAYSFLFMLCTQINHLTEDSMDYNKNFYIHQIINSHNVAPQSFWITLFTGGLNIQIEHHLMPSVSHFRLQKIQPRIEALCRKYGIKYPCSKTLCEALYKHFKHVMKFST